MQTAESGKPVESISGPNRAMMSVLSAWTGYRKGEIGSLTRNSFDLKADPPIVTVEAVSSKRRRKDVQVLHPSVVERLTVWLIGKDVPDVNYSSPSLPVREASSARRPR